MKLALAHYQKISLISGFLITFVFGSLYTLGTITPYIASYIHYQNDPKIYPVDLSILYPAYMVSQIFGIILSMIILQKYIGFKALSFIGVYGVALCAFVTSYFQSFSAYVFFYGVLYGFLVGFCYLIPVLNCYAYLPQKKGLCSGVCMMAYGLGSLVFNFILLDLINPENKKQDQKHLFPIEVAQNVPMALRYISLVYFGIGTVGCLLMIPKSSLKLENELQQEKENYHSIITEVEKKENVQADNKEEPKKTIVSQQTTIFETPFRVLLKSSNYGLIKEQYKQLFLMILTTIPFGAFVAFNYKEYGQTLTQDDQLITTIGSLGALSNSASRVFWCWLFDKYSWKTITLIMNSTQIVCVVLIILIKNPYFYIFLVVLIYFSYGANYGLYPAQTVRIYGDKNGSRIYPITFSAFSIASVIQFLFHYFIVKRMGDDGFLLCFLIFGAFLLIAQVLLFKIDFTYKDDSDKETINQQVKQKKF